VKHSGRCRDCGFLAVRNTETNRLDETPEFTRMDGTLPAGKHWRGPICYVKAQPITEHFKKLPQPKQGPEGFLEIIEEDRHCEQATPYLPDYSPREHYEMILTEKVIEIERKRSEEDRAWREKESEHQRKWEADQAELAEKRHQENLRIAKADNATNVQMQKDQDAFYGRYLRVMWVTVGVAIAAAVISGTLSGWLSAISHAKP
jgi:hypothetical protein